MAKEIGIHEPGLSSYDEAEVPETVFADAIRYAKELIGKDQKRITFEVISGERVIEKEPAKEDVRVKLELSK